MLSYSDLLTQEFRRTQGFLHVFKIVQSRGSQAWFHVLIMFLEWTGFPKLQRLAKFLQFQVGQGPNFLQLLRVYINIKATAFSKATYLIGQGSQTLPHREVQAIYCWAWALL